MDEKVVPAVPTATLVCGVAAHLSGQADYVERAGPAWFVVVGAALALAAWVARSRTAVARVLCIGATALLLPAAVLSIFHLLRLVGAIPFPADPRAAVTSGLAVATLALTWRAVAPLRAEDGGPLPTPRWVALLGLAAAAVYPALKTFWAVGGRWLAPHGVQAGFDADYVVPVAFAALGAGATIAAFRWWDRPAPRFARPTAMIGGLALTGLGVAGMHATVTTPDQEGPVVGILVYGGWLLWGLATLAVAARLSSGRPAARHPG